MTQIFRPQESLSPINLNWITLAGPDASDFLQRLTTVDVKLLPPGGGSAGFFLTPQGKIRSYFTLWNLDPQTFAFEFDSGAMESWKKSLLTAIDQFTFSEKMTLTDLTPHRESAMVFDENFSLNPKHLEVLPNEALICHQDTASFGRGWATVWVPAGQPPQGMSSWLSEYYPHAQPVPYSELEKWRILSLSPRVDSEITEAVLPLEIGLRTAIADQKGCYPGQEVIEKIISLGSPPKRLVQIRGEGICPSAGDSLHPRGEPMTEIGKVTSSSPLEGKHFIALGMVRKTHAKEGLTVQFSTYGEDDSHGTLVKITS